MNKVEIDYPTNWSYKIIATDKKILEKVVSDLFVDRDYELNFSKNSKTKKYISLELLLTVYNDDDRINIFNILKNNNQIIMVI